VQRRESCHDHAILSWDSNGSPVQAKGKVLNLSDSGMAVECFDRLPDRSIVAVAIPQLGRHGLATVRYSTQRGLRMITGLEFVDRRR